MAGVPADELRMNDAKEIAYFEELKSMMQGLGKSPPRPPNCLYGFPPRTGPATPRSGSKLSSGTCGMDEDCPNTDGLVMSAMEVNQEIATALLKDCRRFQREFKDVTTQILGHVVRHEALLRDHQERLDRLHNQDLDRATTHKDTFRDLECRIEACGGKASVDDIGLCKGRGKSADEFIIKVCEAIAYFTPRRAKGDCVAAPMRCGDADMHAVQSNDIVKYEDPVGATFAAFMRATEMRCDHFERQLGELSQEVSGFKAQPIGDRPSLSSIGGESSGNGSSIDTSKDIRLCHSVTSVTFSVDKTLDDVYEFQGSVWDLALFIGMPTLGVLGSIWATLLLFANAFLQVGIVLIINEVFTEQAINADTATAMRLWRVFFGHTFTLADKFTFESLTSRVCKHDPTVPYAEGVLTLLQEISDYMPSPEAYAAKKLSFGHMLPHFESIGVLLCLLAIVIWLLEIVRNCDDKWSLAVALEQLPTCKDMRFHWMDCLVFNDEGDAISLTMMSRQRKAWCGVLIILQYLLILPLAAMGVTMLIFTVHMQDLLLNSAALALVLQTDDAFYAALAPRSGKIMMRALQPLPRRASRTLHGLNWEVPFFAVCIISIVAIAFVPLNQLIQDLKDTYHEICGGNQKFIAVRDNAGIISAGNGGLLIDDVEDTYYFQAMRQLVVDPQVVFKFFAASGSMSATSSGMTSSIWSLKTARDRDVDGVMGYWNSECVDMLPASAHRYSPHFLQILQEVAQNSSILTCNDVRAYCSADHLMGTRARQFCPETCGCQDRSSSLVLDGIIGCPPSCTRSTAFEASMRSKTCVDEGNTSAYWDRLIAGIRSFRASYPSSWVTDFDASIKTLRDHGCNVISDQLPLSFVGAKWTDPCVTSPAKMKPLIFACPVSCRCHTDFRQGCPLTCHQGV